MNYIKIVTVFVIAYLINLGAPALLAQFEKFSSAELAVANGLWCLSLILGFGWVCSYAAEETIFPNFTLQLIVGILLHDALSPIATEIILAVVVCTALAAIILKAGGDEIERLAFTRIAYPVFMIAVAGYLITFFVMFPLMMLLGLDGKTAALLAAMISSTDPAALIPTLKKLIFKTNYKRLADIAVSESALNDVTGALFTTAIASMILAGTSVDTLSELAKGIFSGTNLAHLGQQVLFGCVAGVFGWSVMYGYEKYRSAHYSSNFGETVYDFAIVLTVPWLTFLLALTLHGNGFLAAFIAGLLANYNHSSHYYQRTLQAMDIKIESIAKPVIFMMLGAFVGIKDLLDTALIGMLISLVFIVVARPLAVFLSLLPTNLSTKEKLFLCAVRETGVIPVVLAVITVAQFPELRLLLPLTAWVVIWTLTLLPALTPWWSKTLGIVEEN